jgi:cysteine-rich repeat protein
MVSACGDDRPAAEGAEGAETGDSETGDGDGDPTGSDADAGDGDADAGDGDPGTGDGDPDTGDGDPDTGDGDPDTGDGDPDTGDGDPDTGDGDPDTGDGDPDTGDGDPDTGDGDPEPVCGNGIVEDGEECDDGNDDDTDDCLSTCVHASCGDGFVHQGVETCDDGINDGSYGGCALDCMALGPHCGDNVINGPEQCDDGNEDLTDGCLDNCTIPASCLTLIEYEDSLTDGAYMIAPPGYDGEPFQVWCDMTTDDGGYTFLKVAPGAQHFAFEAEAACAEWGMQLWIPRSLEHKNSGWAIANDGDIGPGAHADYMRILGIYPMFNGAACSAQPMRHDNPTCNWRASDDGPWYVHDVSSITEPNGDNNVIGSQYYQWQVDGNIQWHNDIPGNGYSSDRYMCDVADKQP